MNKRMIILIALTVLATFGAASAGTAVDEVEIRGTIVEADGAGNLGVAGSAGPYCSGYTWDPYTFGAFWYDPDDDLSSEMLRINSILGGGDQRVIPNGQLIYSTTPQVQMYKYCMDTGYPIGTVSGNNVTRYWVEGWMAEKCVAISTGGSYAANANKLSKLLLEFGSNDKKFLTEGEPWDIVGGFTLNATEVGSDGDSVILSLEKNGAELDKSIVDISCTGDKRYMYTETISGVSDVVVFFCYIDAVCVGDPSSVQLKYVYLIDNDIEKISSGTTYGNMKVTTASGSQIVLKNDDDIDLSQNTEIEIMKDMYFRVADSDTVRFYPYKVYIESGDYDVRGTIVEEVNNGNIIAAGTTGAGAVGYTWDPYTFAAFWYELDDDLSSEIMRINTTLTGTDRRTIPTDQLIYATTPQAQDYKYYKDTGEALGNISGNPVTNYAIEGWMAEECVAISTGGSTAANANKLAKRLVEFESSSDKKTLAEGEAWDLGGGFTLNATQIVNNNTVALSLAKDGEVLNETIIDTSPDGDRRYMYTEDLSSVTDVVVFFCYVNAVFNGDPSLVQLTYVYLIDSDVEKIDTGATYGNMEVKTASSSQIVLKNDADIDLSRNTDIGIMNDMYFKVADNSTIRFYPFVERTINGTVPPPPETIPADDVDGDGVPDVWDADNSTPSCYWVNSQGIGRMLGDMNGDGKLTSVDALMILQAAAGNVHYPRTIVDSNGDEITICKPVERIIAYNSDCAEVIRSLGATGNVVGVGTVVAEDDFFPEFTEVPAVGKWNSPNCEMIIALDPDIVLVYGKWPEKAKLEDKLRGTDIKVIRLNFYVPENMTGDVRKLGIVLERENEAAELIDFYQQHTDLIAECVETIPEEERQRMYLEGRSDFKTMSAGSGGDQMCVMAGGINIASDLAGAYPKVDTAWVVAQNPDVIVKTMYSSYDNTSEPEAILNGIISRPGWVDVDAVKNDRVHLLTSDIYTGPGYIIGVAYMAQWLYPDLFADLEPVVMHQEYLERFQSMEMPDEIFVYPE